MLGEIGQMAVCRKCGADTTNYCVKHECANCWEVKHRLKDYLQSSHGKLFVLKTLHDNCPDLVKLDSSIVAVLEYYFKNLRR